MTSIEILTSPSQRQWELDVSRDRSIADIVVAAVKTTSGWIDVINALKASTADYAVLSTHDGIIWDDNLVLRIAAQLRTMSAVPASWLCLAADGADARDNRYATGYYGAAPSLSPDRGLHPIMQTCGSLLVVHVKSFREALEHVHPSVGLIEFLNTAIISSSSRGTGSFFCGALYPVFSGVPTLEYRSASDHLADHAISSNDRLLALMAPSQLMTMLSDWMDTYARTAFSDIVTSFVVRTVFNRPEMLRRCLISIEYIRTSLDIPIEVVIASDAARDLADKTLDDLRAGFPAIRFVFADGSQERGVSRVRNLLAGIKTTSGGRVAIIDDDDYYAPMAVAFFRQSLLYGAEELTVFDTQIVRERWRHNGIKHQVEILSYGQRYDAAQWAVTLTGTNSIPFCGVIHPGWFARHIAHLYAFDYDFSEDFIFHLHCFASSRRPRVRTMSGLGAFQSHRMAGDNVSTVEDRTKWTVDTGNGLFQLLFDAGYTLDRAGAGVLHHDEPKQLAIERNQAVRALARIVGRVGVSKAAGRQ